MGLLNGYRQFIVKSAELALPFTNLTTIKTDTADAAAHASTGKRVQSPPEELEQAPLDKLASAHLGYMGEPAPPDMQ